MSVNPALKQVSQVSFKSGNELNNEFIQLAERLCELGTQANVRIIPYQSPSLPHFSALAFEKRRGVLDSLKSFIGICEATITNGHRVDDSAMFTWTAIKTFGLTPCSDLFGTIADQDVIEIYNVEHLQLFRNFKFFEYCSYSLEAIYCCPWTEMFHRPDPSAMSDFVEIITRTIASQERKTVAGSTRVDGHIVEEANSAFKYKMNYALAYISPLFGPDKTVAAYVLVERAQLLNKPSPIEEELLLSKYYATQRPPPTGPELVN